MDTNLKAVGDAMITALMDTDIDMCGIDSSASECVVEGDKVTFEMNRWVENPPPPRRTPPWDPARRLYPPIGRITYTVTVTATYEKFDPEA